jgi:hypothetical protein
VLKHPFFDKAQNLKTVKNGLFCPKMGHFFPKTGRFSAKLTLISFFYCATPYFSRPNFGQSTFFHFLTKAVWISSKSMSW